MPWFVQPCSITEEENPYIRSPSRPAGAVLQPQTSQVTPISNIANHVALEGRKRIFEQEQHHHKLIQNSNDLYHLTNMGRPRTESSGDNRTNNIENKINRMKENNNLALKLAMDAKNNALKKRLSSTGSEIQESPHQPIGQTNSGLGFCRNSNNFGRILFLFER